MNFQKGILLFTVQVVLTFVAAFNMRSIAQGNYLWTSISEIIIALLAFFALTEIAAKTNRTAKLIGFVVGSVCGSLLGIYLSIIILKQ